MTNAQIIGVLVFVSSVPLILFSGYLIYFKVDKKIKESVKVIDTMTKIVENPQKEYTQEDNLTFRGLLKQSNKLNNTINSSLRKSWFCMLLAFSVLMIQPLFNLVEGGLNDKGFIFTAGHITFLFLLVLFCVWRLKNIQKIKE